MICFLEKKNSLSKFISESIDTYTVKVELNEKFLNLKKVLVKSTFNTMKVNRADLKTRSASVLQKKAS